MRRFLVVSLALCAPVALSCGDDNSGPTDPVITTGSIEVLLTMTGTYLDGDGCQASLDGGESRLLEQEAPVTFGDLSPGSHTVLLDDVAANCSIAGKNPRDAEVVAGQTAQTTYHVECTPCGAGYGPYQAVDLGTLSGGWSKANDINNHGQVVGIAAVGEYTGQAFIWQDGEVTALADPDLTGTPTAINERGQVVGRGGLNSHAWLWEDGVVTDLGAFSTSTSWAEDINNHGQVVGGSVIEAGVVHAFMWEDGVMIDLGTLGGSSRAYAINDSGQVVGYSLTHDGDWYWDRRAFLWEDGVMIDLGTLGGSRAEAKDINDHGQVVGFSRTAEGTEHIFLWEDGVMTDLGVDANAVDINNCGQLAGNYGAYREHRVFLWEDGVLTDVGPVVHERPWDFGFNDAGQIVGHHCEGFQCDPDYSSTQATLWTRSY